MGEPFDPTTVESFAYESWDVDEAARIVHLRYRLDALGFEEQFTLPVAHGVDERAIELLFVCAGVSYYKAAAPPVVEGVPPHLVAFAAELYLHGLAEYAMTNGLDPIRPRFETGSRARSTAEPRWNDAEKGSGRPALVAVGGGKDSVVTIESLRRAGRSAVLASVNTHPAIAAAADASHFHHLVIERRMDPLLVELNARGARNGHVPVTAINSCALAVLSTALGGPAVVMSNESSASVPIAEHRGLPVNHQWSKSVDCERLLSSLLPVPYFSLLRPLHEVEIARRFTHLPQYFDAVTSCNRAYTAAGRAAGVRWCGDCPKCRFVFLALAAFLDRDDVRGIFDGLDLLGDPTALDAYRAIVGLGGDPPLECVGTLHESRWALARLRESAWRDHAVVRTLGPEVSVVTGWDPLSERGPHCIPDDWLEVADALA